MTKQGKGEAGVLVHAVRTVAIHDGLTSMLLHYGDEAVLLPRHVEASRNALGEVTLWNLVDDPNGPLRRGPWPHESRTEPGSARWDQERVEALQAAASLPDPDQQRIAAAKVREKYGSAPEARSRTIANYREAR